MTTEIVIKTNLLTKEFNKKKAVDNLNIEIKRGEIFGFLGPNGSGKSTTIKLLCGLITPTSGDATVNNYSVLTEGEKIRKEIGYMSQKFSLYEDLTIKQNLKFYSILYRITPNEEQEERINEVMKLTHIDEEENKQVAKLSGGFKQRLAFACALLHKPKIIFLDEPTAGIDPVARKEMWDLFFKLASDNLTLFITTHYMDEAERCTKLGYIHEGKLIVYGITSELASSKQGLEELFVSITKTKGSNVK
ncbi:MAG: ABC transporter ATP-binding protein [Candidatus Melainabacteria bacterium]|nr:ABC transporter ATP-binding protein [Candidatus Melainabacteria bacterium]